MTALLAFACAQNAHGGAASDSSAQPRIVDQRPLFTEDDLLLLEVRVRGSLITDSLGAYSSRAGVFLPLGELARLLDFSISVDPPARSASGWFLSQDRHFLLEMDSGTADVNGRRVEFAATDAVLDGSEIYVTAALLGKLLPLTLDVSKSESVLRITPTERLPFEERMEREQRREGLQARGNDDTHRRLTVSTPYEAFAWPAADFNLGLGLSSEAPKETTVWDARVAGDAGYAGFQAYVGSDDSGAPQAARFTIERRGFARDGRDMLTGPRASAGDVYTPALGIGMASHGGRGVALSSAPEQQASVFDKVDVRGELQAGFEVELYVNEVLRASQAMPMQGQYEFTNVSLVFGMNVVRLAFYGPRGERYEEVRRINVGGGQLARGKAQFSAGIVEQGVPLVEFDAPDIDPELGDPAYGEPGYSAALAYGLSNWLTTRVGAGHYTPFRNDSRNLVNAGLAAALGGLSAQIDYSRDDAGGQAQALGLAGQLGNLPFVLSHTEYQGNYADELSGAGISRLDPLRRYTELRTDFQLRLPGVQRTFPMSFNARRDERNGGATDWTGAAQVTGVAGRLLVSGALGYNRSERPAYDTVERMTVSLDVATMLYESWQARANVTGILRPAAEVQATTFTVDRNLSSRTAVRFGVQQSWIEDRFTSLTTSMTWRLPFMDVSLAGNYVTRTDQWTAGVVFSAGSLFDPLRRRYATTRPGATAGGALALLAFIDSDGDGQRDAGEAPLPGLRLQGTGFTPTADAQGRLIATGLGDAGVSTINIDLESIEDPYLTLPADSIEVITRPGRVAIASFPMQTNGEATVRFTIRLPNGTERGLSALQAQLVDSTGRPVAQGRSEYDGTLLFERLPPGRYAVRLDPEQSQRLRMSIVEPVDVVVTSGGYAGVTEARIQVQR